MSAAQPASKEMTWYTIDLIKKVYFYIYFLKCKKAGFLVKVSSTLRNKREFRITHKLFSQCTKTGYDLLYKAILFRKPVELSKVEPTELKYYP